MANPNPASNPPEPQQFPVQFGRYLLHKKLGEGGMGEVFLASTQSSIEGAEKTCVIKKLRRMFTHDEEFVARFLDEARLMVQLTHINIVPVFDAGELNGDYFLAMELVDGADLRELIENATRHQGTLPQHVALYIAREILGALGYVHKKKDVKGVALGLVHRDISPQNILCSLAGEVKLIDFGLAKSTQKNLKTDPRVVLGKYAYMSPEQARGQPVDGRSDLFSVGLLLFEMLTNRKLFDGVTVGELMEQIAEHRVFAPSKVQRGIDPEVDALVVKALLKDAGERFQTAEAFRDALSRILTRVAPTISADDLLKQVRSVRGLTPAGVHPVRPDEPTQGGGEDEENTNPDLPDAAEVAAHGPGKTPVARETALVRGRARGSGSGPDPDPHPPQGLPAVAVQKEARPHEPDAASIGKLLVLSLLAGVMVLGVGVALWWFLKGMPDTPESTAPPQVKETAVGHPEPKEGDSAPAVRKEEKRPTEEKKPDKGHKPAKGKKKKKGH